MNTLETPEDRLIRERIERKLAREELERIPDCPDFMMPTLYDLYTKWDDEVLNVAVVKAIIELYMIGEDTDPDDKFSRY